ncbi:MAG: hypothetical protein IT223_07605 [Crocinitomicaceae bacterium]|nr:hypothetical protein [Crocinitomicaceae bacterium]
MDIDRHHIQNTQLLSMFSASIICILLTMLVGSITTSAQEKINWKLTFDDASLNSEWANKNFSERSAADSALSKVYQSIVALGFIDASLDTSSSQGIIRCTVNFGKKYIFGNAVWEGDSLLNKRLASQQGVPTGTFFSTKNLEWPVQKRLDFLENNGYPFSSIILKQIEISGDSIHTVWKINRGPRILMDSLIIKSESRLPYRYLRSYVDFRKDAAYSEATLQTVKSRLSEIAFITPLSPPQVLFSGNQASIYLTLKKKKANYFNGVVGIQPNDKTGHISMTGDAEIKLLNALNSGEELYLNWRRLQLQTQELKMRASFPFLFSTPLGTEGDIKIYRRDSTFSTLKMSLGVLLQLGGQNRLKIFAEKNQSSGLSSHIINATLANVNSTLYGISVQLEKLNYRLNPRSGYSCLFEAATGKRDAMPTSGSDIGLPASNRNVFRFQGKTELFIPTFSSQCIRLGQAGAWYDAVPVFTNEMYRIGGLQTIRGIDEESIFSSAYATATVEYRYLFDVNSAVYLFADQNWYERKDLLSYIHDTPVGFGAGLNFDTSAGIFTFNYALAQQFDNPILVRNAKLSFGFRNVF